MYDSGRNEIKIFLLTRPLRDVTVLNGEQNDETFISTHTPLTGRDLCELRYQSLIDNFYSHAPYGT